MLKEDKLQLQNPVANAGSKTLLMENPYLNNRVFLTTKHICQNSVAVPMFLL